MFGAISLMPYGEAMPATSNPLALPPPHIGLKQAQIAKDRLATRYDEAISLAMPGRDGLNQGPDQGEIYDDTAMIAVPEFASRIQQGVMPNFSRWASFVAGVLIDDEDTVLALRKQLETVDRYLFEMINSSNFSIEANECFTDLALGTGAIRIDEAATGSPFSCRSVPLRGLLFLIGPDGMPDPVWEMRKMTRASIMIHYPSASLPMMSAIEDPYFEHTVVECWQRDWSEPAAMKYRQSVYMTDHNNAIIYSDEHEGEGACPYIVFRWSKASGEVWGRGPLFQCLPSVRKCNFIERAVLDHVDVAIGGIWTMEDDGVVNVETVKLATGTIVPVAPGSQGLKNVAAGIQFELPQFALTESRATIKAALYTEQLGNPNKTPMSATEVQQRMNELARAIGSPFVRLILEFLMPAIVRFIRILKDRKLITMPTIDGKQIKLISTSPLSQAQRFEDIDSISKWLELVRNTLGPEAVNIIADGSEVGGELADLFKVPAKLLRPKAQQLQIMQQAAQAAGAQANGGQPGQAPPADGGSQPPG